MKTWKVLRWHFSLLEIAALGVLVVVRRFLPRRVLPDLAESWEVTESTLSTPASFTLVLGKQPVLYRDVNVESPEHAEHYPRLKLAEGTEFTLSIGGVPHLRGVVRR